MDVEAHRERDRNRHSHGEDTPRTLGEGTDDDVPETSERDDDDEEDRDGGDEAERRSELLSRDLGERTSSAPRARDEDDEVVNRSAEHDAEQDPKEPRIEAELRREHG